MRNTLFFLIALFTFLISSSLISEGNEADNGRLIGGKCEYKRYKGQAKIISVNKIKGYDLQNEGYEVKFTFTPEEKIKEDYAKTEGKEFLLLLENSSYPKAEFLEKYGIEINRVFDCYIKVITKGACTPILFEFPDIRLDDYL